MGVRIWRRGKGRAHRRSHAMGNRSSPSPASASGIVVNRGECGDEGEGWDSEGRGLEWHGWLSGVVVASLKPVFYFYFYPISILFPSIYSLFAIRIRIRIRIRIHPRPKHRFLILPPIKPRVESCPFSSVHFPAAVISVTCHVKPPPGNASCSPAISLYIYA